MMSVSTISITVIKKIQQVNSYQAGSDLNQSFMYLDFLEDLFRMLDEVEENSQ